MSDKTPQGETEEEYLERIKNVPGIYSEYNETAKEVVERPDYLVLDSKIRSAATDLAPLAHAEPENEPDEDVSGYVYPGTADVKPEKVDEPEDDESEETEEEETTEDEVEDATGPAGKDAAELPAEEQAGQPAKLETTKKK